MGDGFTEKIGELSSEITVDIKGVFSYNTFLYVT